MRLQQEGTFVSDYELTEEDRNKFKKDISVIVIKEAAKYYRKTMPQINSLDLESMRERELKHKIKERDMKIVWTRSVPSFTLTSFGLVVN